MRLLEVLLLYLLVGGLVGVWAKRSGHLPQPVALVLWPLWLPALLAPTTARYDTVTARPEPLARLASLLAAWDPGMSPSLDVLAAGLGRLAERRAVLARELARPENDLEVLRRHPGEGAAGEAHRRRLANVEALAALHDQLAREHDTALAQVEELCSRVQLARFGGVSVEGVGAELAALVAAIEGAREVEAVGRGPRHPRAEKI